ncbi:hypothetical protein ACFPOI_31990 [Nonomuraea angiospora]|uniref:Uncharacterized protein n=1 Tax=Nonomuraea angiospora TaxID=46172 RepID=A0ABR9LS07_9ACTN|nr:hypothetical protein [Nonomuraea angiospora]MBE1583447.1 hypothetical protein [Nonomuraea angiospora]
MSTSKWTATREQPVAASRSSRVRVDERSSLGAKDRMPHAATLPMSSSVHERRPAGATRSGQVVAVAAGELAERRHAHRAFAAQGRDPCRVVPADDLQGLGELADDRRLGLDAVVGHGDRYGPVGPWCGGSTASRTVVPTA